MLKYTETLVVFAEVPDEVTLAINISNCPNRCPSCHSKYLWDDIGTPLTSFELERLINQNSGITCVAFMGGDASPDEVLDLAFLVHEEFGLKTCWYTGRTRDYWESTDLFPENYDVLDYVKFGPYDEQYGALDCKTTNQRFYKVDALEDGTFGLEDWTPRFYKLR